MTIEKCEECGIQADEEIVLTVIERQVCRATRWEPAEYEERLVCASCEETLTHEHEPDPDRAYDERGDW